ncbi:MAG: NAD(P)-binding protein [Pseudomonadota bacterium]
MDKRDRQLGMGADITRRDFLSGVSVAVGASLLPGCDASGEGALSNPMAEYYPPALTGMRGSHDGSFEVAHALANGKTWDATRRDEHYDLVIVGAGISGLASAYIYRRDVDPDARILILDNHDDFGGHAKRNEFQIDGRTIIGFGGTMNMDAPGHYPAAAKQVIRELGFFELSEAEYPRYELFQERGLSAGSFFDKETFGKDQLSIVSDETGDDFSDTPLSWSAQFELERLYANEIDFLEGKSMTERGDILWSTSWRDYLARYAGLGDEALNYLQKRPHGWWAIGADALPAWMAYTTGYPGFTGTSIPFEGDGEQEDSGIFNRSFHFPDGNASVARMLVRKLIPGIAPGSTVRDVVTAPFDYSRLDENSNATRIRLNSTVVGLEHQQGDLGADVDVTYVRDDSAVTISASKVVWAGYHAVVPHICPDVPAEQATAQSATVRAPLVYTNVLIRNWTSFEKLGTWSVYCPGSFFESVSMDFPVDIGGYRFSSNPDEPVVLHLQHIPLQPGLPAIEQFRAGRGRLLTTSFEDFERNIRDQLQRMLGPGGFSAADDIAAITVNRWPHGYAYASDPETGEVAWWPEHWRGERKPWIIARQSIGNIHFAGTDSSSDAMTESAIEEAYRAVRGLAGESST